MAQVQLVDSVRNRVSDAEWQMRVDLAAAIAWSRISAGTT